MNTIKDDVDEKTLLIEYKRKHDELINCGLLLNSYFDNINIIINQFMVNYPLFSEINDNKKLELSLTSSTSSTLSESSIKSGANIDNLEDQDFSIYYLFLTIIKNSVNNKLFNSVVNKFEILLKQYFNKTFEEFKENEIEEKSDKDDEMAPPAGFSFARNQGGSHMGYRKVGALEQCWYIIRWKIRELFRRRK